MSRRIFITGTGTGIGKTIVSAIISHALGAGYWKPVQAGMEDTTDAECVRLMHDSADLSRFPPPAVSLRLAASPHLAARAEHKRIEVAGLVSAAREQLAAYPGPWVIEGAGGILVPLNESETILDLALALEASIVIVSRNYLGSINHSLLTARVLKQAGADVAGWVFVDRFMDYEAEIAAWSGFPILASIPWVETPGPGFVREQAEKFKTNFETIV